MAITFQAEGIALPKIKKRETAHWIKTVAKNYHRKVGEIAYLFCDDEQILAINRKYLQHDYYTDIITFDYSEEDTLSGDIFISIDTVHSNSQKYQTDYEEELHRVIIHGILHLCGVNDQSEEEAKEMRAAENSALLLLKKSE